MPVTFESGELGYYVIAGVYCGERQTRWVPTYQEARQLLADIVRLNFPPSRSGLRPKDVVSIHIIHGRKILNKWTVWDTMGELGWENQR